MASVTDKYTEEKPLQTTSQENTFAVGELLKKARERRLMTLAQASNKLRLTSYVIQAIEEGRTQDIPQNQAYLRCFVRAYAKILDLDPVAIDQKFKEELPVQKQEELLFPVEKIQKTSPKKWIFFFSILATILVSLVSFYLIHQTQTFSNQNAPEISFLLPAPALRKLTPLPSYQVLFVHFLKTGKTGFAEKEAKMSYATTQWHLLKSVHLVAQKTPCVHVKEQIQTPAVKPVTSAHHLYALPKVGKKSLLLAWTSQRFQHAQVLLKENNRDLTKQCSHRPKSKVNQPKVGLNTNLSKAQMLDLADQHEYLISNS